MTSRPELTGHASLFYNQKEARKYNSSSRMIGVQREITERAIELLRLDSNSPSLILDVGCGSGLSGQVLEEKGHVWVGCDVSRDMLDVANERQQARREKEQEMDQDGADMKEEDSDEEEEDEGPTTGDLMHHVSSSPLRDFFLPKFDFDSPKNGFDFVCRIWELAFPFVQQPLMPAFRFRLSNGCATPIPKIKIHEKDSCDFSVPCILY